MATGKLRQRESGQCKDLPKLARNIIESHIQNPGAHNHALESCSAEIVGPQPPNMAEHLSDLSGASHLNAPGNSTKRYILQRPFNVILDHFLMSKGGGYGRKQTKNADT